MRHCGIILGEFTDQISNRNTLPVVRDTLNRYTCYKIMWWINSSEAHKKICDQQNRHGLVRERRILSRNKTPFSKTEAENQVSIPWALDHARWHPEQWRLLQRETSLLNLVLQSKLRENDGSHLLPQGYWMRQSAPELITQWLGATAGPSVACLFCSTLCLR